MKTLFYEKELLDVIVNNEEDENLLKEYSEKLIFLSLEIDKIFKKIKQDLQLSNSVGGYIDFDNNSFVI
jgi:hypothetical protein